jgi:hypothetical protein
VPIARHEDAQPQKRRPMADGLAPEEAAKAMSAPPGFSVKLLAAEPDVRQPIAMCFDDRGRLWVAEAYAYPKRVAPEEARDRILIFEDTDGDHRLDSRKVFKDGLNLVSGLAVGFGAEHDDRLRGRQRAGGGQRRHALQRAQQRSGDRRSRREPQRGDAEQ